MIDSKADNRRGHRATLLAACAIALPSLIALALLAAGAPARLELETAAARFDLRGRSSAPEEIVLVAIDRETLTALDSTWPLPRRLHARAIDRLTTLGAREIAYDVEFPGAGRTRGDRQATAAVAAAAQRAGNVVFAAFAPNADGQTNVLGSAGGAASVLTGYSGLRTGNGLPVSRVPVSVSGLRSLSSQIAERAGARIPDDLPDGEAWIDFAGAPGTIAQVHFSDLLEGRVPRSAIDGRIAVVAATDPGIKDVLPTIAPSGDQMSGGEVQANAISTWLRGVPLHSSPGWLDITFVLVMGLTVPLLGTRLAPRRVWPCACILLIGFLVTVQVLFNVGVVVTVVAPLTAFALSLGVWLALGYQRADRERQQLLQRFAAGDPRIVEPILAGATQAAGGISAEDIVPGYRLEEVLGRGGMGVVYRATDVSNGRAVAIKVLAPEHAESVEFRRRFEREARITASLEHPNVLPVYAFGEHDGIAYLVTRLVDGGDLAARLRRDGPVQPTEALRIASAVAAGLDAAHAAHLVHRDVKPANILLDDRGGHVYLADFGVASEASATALTTAGSRVGTIAYSAPEQLAGRPADAAADIYALACVLFAMVEGRVPFERETEAATIGAILHESAPAVTAAPWLTPVIARALSREPSERYASAGTFASAAEEALAGGDARPTLDGARNDPGTTPGGQTGARRLGPHPPRG